MTQMLTAEPMTTQPSMVRVTDFDGQDKMMTLGDGLLYVEDILALSGTTLDEKSIALDGRFLTDPKMPIAAGSHIVITPRVANG